MLVVVFSMESVVLMINLVFVVGYYNLFNGKQMYVFNVTVIIWFNGLWELLHVYEYILKLCEQNESIQHQFYSHIGLKDDYASEGALKRELRFEKFGPIKAVYIFLKPNLSVNSKNKIR